MSSQTMLDDFKIAVISDTHGNEPNLPSADLLIHCGDVCERGFRFEVYNTFCWLEDQRSKFKNIIYVPGNHDLWCYKYPEKIAKVCKDLDIDLLVNDSITINGIKIYGFPQVPYYHGSAYNVPQGEMFNLICDIPKDINILASHGPPLWVLDLENKHNLGCKILYDAIFQNRTFKNLKLNVFGHIHQGRENPNNGSVNKDGVTFINASYCKEYTNPYSGIQIFNYNTSEVSEINWQDI